MVSYLQPRFVSSRNLNTNGMKYPLLNTTGLWCHQGQDSLPTHHSQLVHLLVLKKFELWLKKVLAQSRGRYEFSTLARFYNIEG